MPIKPANESISLDTFENKLITEDIISYFNEKFTKRIPINQELICRGLIIKLFTNHDGEWACVSSETKHKVIWLNTINTQMIKFDFDNGLTFVVVKTGGKIRMEFF